MSQKIAPARPMLRPARVPLRAREVDQPLARHRNSTNHWTLPLALCGGAISLVASWIWPGSRGVWNRVDSEFFHALNTTLAWNEPWAYFWAQVNCRWFDACVGAALIGAAAWSFRRRANDEKLRAAVSLGLTGLFAILWQQFVSTQVLEKICAYHRLSPSLVHPHSVRLSEIYPELSTKDASPWCFPSDHGFVLIVLAGYFGLYGSRRSRCFFALAAIALALPRLVAGAHWVTDFAIGSGAMALLFVGFFLTTPIHDRLTDSVMLAWCRLRSSVRQRMVADRPRARPIVVD